MCNPVTQATTDGHYIRLPKPFEELTEKQRSTVNNVFLDKNDLTKRVISTKSNNVITGEDLKEGKAMVKRRGQKSLDASFELDKKGDFV